VTNGKLVEGPTKTKTKIKIKIRKMVRKRRLPCGPSEPISLLAY
jgi:hypothetical protein